MMASKSNACLPDLQTAFAAGIDPRTGLPLKLGGFSGRLTDLANEMKKNFRIKDEQLAVNRYTWYNLPNDLTGQMIERILYYKGQAILFYMAANNKFYFLPYALNGNIDVYGRYLAVSPIPYAGGTVDHDGKERPWIQGLIRYPVYDLESLFDENGKLKRPTEDCCVILRDYTQQLGEMSIPRQILNDPLLEAMSEAIPMARTNLISNSGIKGMRVPDADSATQVILASQSITNAALTGTPWIPIKSSVEFQDLTDGSIMKTDEYMMYLQSLDNLRLSLYGVESGGVFEKKGTILQSEYDINSGINNVVYQDGLTLRQHFCDIVNFLFADKLNGQLIWCEASESIKGDTNGDGFMMDNQDQSGVPGEQPQGMEDDSDE